MKRTFFLALALLVLAVSLCGCSAAEKVSLEYEVTELTRTVASADDLEALSIYPNLAKLDLRGSTCYDEILAYIAAHPEMEVLYDVTLGGTLWSPDIQALTLIDGSCDFEELLGTLRYLPQVTSLSLPETSLSDQELDSLTLAYPHITLEYTLAFGGQVYPMDTESLDLSGMTREQLPEVTELLSRLPCLTQVELMNGEGKSDLDPVDVKALMNAAPNAVFNYSFELFGQTVTTAQERVEFLNVPIGNEGIPEIRAALDILPNCTYFLMDTCGVDNEIMAQLREDYADTTKIVWRVWLVPVDYSSRLFLRTGSYLTDTHRIRTTYVNDKNSHVLNYCTETKYVDVGHVWQLTQCDFLSYMPDLEVCIIAITFITDITPLANHEKLEYLELFTTDISDISPLLTCPNIEHLNLSNMPYLDDISPVFSLKKLKRIRIVDSPLVSDEEKRQLEEALPDCKHLYMGHWATAWGWRYIDGGKENPDPRYELLCQQMEYHIDAYEYGIP